MFKVKAVLAMTLLAAVIVPLAVGDSGLQVDLLDMSLEELTQMVFTSSRQVQEANETAAKVHVITAEMIAASGAQSLDQVLRLIPGFQVRTWLWGFTNTSIRGMVGGSPINERLLWMVDGVPINDVRDAGIWTDVTVFPLEMIERIEVMSGPHSSVYGSSAFQGVVSIFTKQAEDLSEEGEFSFAYGRNSTRSALASIPLIGDKSSSVLAVQNYKTDEHRIVSDYSGKAVTWVRGQTRVGKLKAYYGGRSFSMKYPSIFATPYENYSETRSEIYGNLQYDLEINPNLSLLLLPSYHFWHDHFWDFGDVPGLQYHQDSYRLSNLAQLRAKFDDRTNLTLAIALHREAYEGNDFHPDHRDLSLNRAEAFGEFAIELFDWFKVDIGASSQFGETVSTKKTGIHPRIAALTKITESLRLRTSYSTGYREPSWWHRYINTVDAEGNPDLFAEELKAYEISLEYDFSHGSAYLSYFNQKVEHGMLEIYDPSLADPDYLEYGIFGKFNPVQAEGEFEMQGLDFSGSTDWFDGRMNLKAGYSYLDSKQPDGRDTPYDAKHRINAFVQITPNRLWSFNYGLHVVGKTVDAELEYVPIDVEEPDLGLIGLRDVDAYMIHQLTLGIRPTENWEFKLGVWDIGNDVYQEYLGVDQQGGLWMARIGYRP
ncbi:TonB-dependent receptor [bacterium]|nr:TonB-dependent receptor [bacterium]